MSRQVIIAIVLLVVAGVAVFFMSGASDAVSQNADRDRLLPVEVAEVDMRDAFEAEARYAGRITASRSSNLGFERPGLLASVAVDEGAKVKAGDVLASLDTRSLEAQLAQARAQENEASARLALANVTVNRQKQLLDRKNVSEQRYDEARFNRQATAAQLAGARASIQALEVALELATIRAPYDGDIVARMVDEGTVVNAGQPIFRLLESAALEAHIGIPPETAATLNTGTIYQVDVRGQLYPAVLSQVLSEVDAETRTISAIFLVEAPLSDVRAGELARVVLTQEVREPGFWVPLEALSEGRRGLWAVYVVAPDDADGTQEAVIENAGVIERRTVQLLHTEAARAYVRGTLRDGEAYVSNGTHRLVPGQRVRVLDAVAQVQ
ncbi:efflux RND transporter periplasmic adaptor subunit [Pyruvatibacter sp.]|uniref:efflux RND transporter periplasmic adaptor subunit n=1 Tax=Pyruvatibacter sp. TaxID=1981328 RepID=UPI0032EF8EF8